MPYCVAFRLRLLAVFAAAVAVAGAPAFPLKTTSRWIIDQTGARVKLACANWSGGEEKDYVSGGLNLQKLDVISGTFAAFGFNCVRLLWSLEIYEFNAVVRADRLTANPHLIGSTALEVFDAVVESLTAHGLMVILGTF